jgi:hypothetical protein
MEAFAHNLLNEETLRKFYTANRLTVSSYSYISGLIDASLHYKEISQADKDSLDLLNDALYEEYKSLDNDS